MANDLTIRDNDTVVPFESQQLAAPPKMILEQAMVAAKALKEVLDKKEKPVVFNGEQYLEFEDWQTLARFYGYTVQIRNTSYVQFGSVGGFEAAADVLNVKNGQVVSSAEAMCLNDEENWGMVPEYKWQDVLDAEGKNIWDDKKKRYRAERVLIGEKPKPLFQLRSMAQTRACAKALRNVLAWVVVLAGYRPTPAEEMSSVPPSETKPPAAKKSTSKASTSVKCEECNAVNSHSPKCSKRPGASPEPPQAQETASAPQGAAPRAAAPPEAKRGTVIVTKVDPRMKGERAYMKLLCVDRDGNESDVFSWHANSQHKHLVKATGKECEFSISTTSKDGKDFYQLEQIHRIGTTEFKDGEPVEAVQGTVL